MKFLVLASLLFSAFNAQAVKLQCGNLTIEMDEVSLKTTMTDQTSDSVLVSYATLKRRLVSRQPRPTYQDVFLFPVNQMIIKNASIYVYSQQNNAGQTVVPNTRCTVESP